MKHVRIVISLLFFSCLVSIELSVRGLLYIQGERLGLLPRPTDEIGRCWHAHIDLIPISYSALEEEHLYLRVSGVQKRFIPQRKIHDMYFGSSFFILFLPVDIHRYRSYRSVFGADTFYNSEKSCDSGYIDFSSFSLLLSVEVILKNAIVVMRTGVI